MYESVVEVGDCLFNSRALLAVANHCLIDFSVQ